jgi:hypothetical protein
MFMFSLMGWLMLIGFLVCIFISFYVGFKLGKKMK